MISNSIFNDHAMELEQLNRLGEQKLFAEALALAEQQLEYLLLNPHVDKWSADVAEATRLIDESRSALRKIELTLSDLSNILRRLDAQSEQTGAQIINTLTLWLNNAQRMKAHAAINR